MSLITQKKLTATNLKLSGSKTFRFLLFFDLSVENDEHWTVTEFDYLCNRVEETIRSIRFIAPHSWGIRLIEFNVILKTFTYLPCFDPKTRKFRQIKLR